MRILLAVAQVWILIGVAIVGLAKAAMPMLLFTGPAQLVLRVVGWPWFAWIVATGQLVRN